MEADKKIRSPYLSYSKIDSLHNKVNVANNVELVKTFKQSVTDADGLEKAYKTPSGIHIFGDRMYIAGTRDNNDIKDDIFRIPFWGNSQNIQRYKDAKEELLKNPQVTNLTGHSLGGSVALQLQKDFDQVKSTRTFGAPVYDWGRSLAQQLLDKKQGKPEPVVERYRHGNDPVSMFDQSAHMVLRKELTDNIHPLRTHNYRELASQFTTTAEVPEQTTNPDGTTSLIA